MDKQELLFYNEYEQFYHMAETSEAFRKFYSDAFGEDLSQDGFSDMAQIERILAFIPKGEDVHILDVGCGNGKMLRYIQSRTGAYIHGFDYSENAINEAKAHCGEHADFICGCMGEVGYEQEMFHVITSMDTIYFAPDMAEFTEQLMGWLKEGGVLFVGYQEGDVMPVTGDAYTTEFARVLTSKGIDFGVEDITKETYEMLKKKRAAALSHEKGFAQEGNSEWFGLLMMQTECAEASYEEFSKNMARYIYVVRKK